MNSVAKTTLPACRNGVRILIQMSIFKTIPVDRIDTDNYGSNR